MKATLLNISLLFEMLVGLPQDKITFCVQVLMIPHQRTQF